ncbi:Penicillin-binding protein activator LpoB [Candidatus Hepatincola sp. Pdp]
MKNLIKKYTVFLALLLLSACAGGTSYQGVEQNKGSSTFSVQDQKMLVDTLATKLTQDATLKQEVMGRPTLLIDEVNNKTSEQIDTQSMTDTLKMNIVKSHLFSIISRDKTNLLAKEQQLAQSGLADNERATQLGKLWGAKYVMYGNFSSIVNYVGKEKQTYYKFTLILQNIETGEEIWIDEAEVNKVTKKPLF